MMLYKEIRGTRLLCWGSTRGYQRAWSSSQDLHSAHDISSRNDLDETFKFLLLVKSYLQAGEDLQLRCWSICHLQVNVQEENKRMNDKKAKKSEYRAPQSWMVGDRYWGNSSFGGYKRCFTLSERSDQCQKLYNGATLQLLIQVEEFMYEDGHPEKDSID
ncbi:hypothetical protein Tco_0378291 [Tanacetum coccineum]